VIDLKLTREKKHKFTEMQNSSKLLLCVIISICQCLFFQIEACVDTLPQNGDNAVYIEFFTNTQGGAEGSDCPVACDSPVRIYLSIYHNRVITAIFRLAQCCLTRSC